MTTTSGTTRAQFLRRGATGGLALVAGGGLLASAAGPALAAGSDPSDVDIARLAATAELLAVGAARGPVVPGPELSAAQATAALGPFLA